MDDFIVRFNEFTENRYPYLRIKKVEIFKYERRAYIFFYVPDRIYENGFDNNLQKDLNRFCYKIAPGIRCEFNFEPLIMTDELVKENIEEFCASHFPFITSSISKDCIQVTITDVIGISITIEEDVFAIIKQTDFAKNLILYIQESYIYPAEINFNIVSRGVIKLEKTEESFFATKKTVPIKSFDFLCGVNYKQINHPIFADAITRNQDNACVCGLVDDIIKRELEEDPKSTIPFKKYLYKFVLNDLSGKITVYFKTNDEECPLKEITIGKELLAKGKIAYSMHSGQFVMYAKSVYECSLDVEAIKEALKPLPPPTTLKQPAEKYEGQDFFEMQTLEDFDKDNHTKEFDCVFLTYNSVSEKDFIPWKLTMLSFVKGKCTEVYDTFVRVSNLDAIDVEYKSKVNLAKRLPDIVGDILCFTNGKTVVCRNPQSVVKEINRACKPFRWSFDVDCLDADKVGMKVSKGEADLYKNIKNNGIVLKTHDSYDVAIALAKLFIKVKK